jgi:hypothetical protein
MPCPCFALLFLAVPQPFSAQLCPAVQFRRLSERRSAVPCPCIAGQSTASPQLFGAHLCLCFVVARGNVDCRRQRQQPKDSPGSSSPNRSSRFDLGRTFRRNLSGVGLSGPTPDISANKDVPCLCSSPQFSAMHLRCHAVHSRAVPRRCISKLGYSFATQVLACRSCAIPLHLSANHCPAPATHCNPVQCLCCACFRYAMPPHCESEPCFAPAEHRTATPSHSKSQLCRAAACPGALYGREGAAGIERR